MHRMQTYTAQLSPAVHTRRTAFLEQQRLLYHAALEERLGAYQKAGVSLSRYDQTKSLTQLREDSEFAQYDLKCHRSCLFTLARAFKGFFRRVKAGQQPGFPRFKSKDRDIRSFSTSQPRVQAHGQWNRLSIKGMGRLRFKGQVEGMILKARVVQTPIRVVIQRVIELPDTQPAPNPPPGIDVGIQARVTLSDGQRWTKNAGDRERLTVLQQRRSAAKPRSKNRQKRKRMLAKEGQRVREQEHGQLHAMTADLVKKTHCYDVENLNVQGMLGTHYLARATAEQQWGTFVNLFTYKAASAGGWVRKVDPKHTSQDGSRCGARVQQTLSDRLHVCTRCGLSRERDWNAARNILNRGLEVRPPSGEKDPRIAIGGKNGMLGQPSI